MKQKEQKLLCLALMCAFGMSTSGMLQAASASLTVHADQPGARINPAMWGLFFEDINFGADGGLYAELIKNRSFEFPDPMMGWIPILSFSSGRPRGALSIESVAPFSPANPHYLRIQCEFATYGVMNEGFRGMGLREGENYDFTAQIRASEGSSAVRVELVNPTGQVLASAKLTGLASEWKKHATTLKASATEPKARLKVILEGKGKVDFDMVSLFPRKTWKQRPGGLRADMVQLLADMKPGFLRFPGGCIVEGNVLTNRYQWKTTIGPVEERKLIVNRWNFEFRHRPTPDYYQSFGLGFFEYFQLAEDLGAEPLPILNCGMACQFNSGELVPLDELDPYVQDALDLIEFANGPASSPWGAKRAAMGHPKPFNLKMIGIGNEQWGPQFIERYAIFHRVLKDRHPEITLVSGSGPSPADERFDFLWPKLRELNADIVDEHCYANPIWFLSNANRYDRYDRNGPKVFFSEYAAQSDRIVSVNNENNWECALAEAAFMTGMERNADIVRLASYAPLFGHADAWQWRPNLIWADNLRAYGTPNYHVQSLFARNRGDTILPVQLTVREQVPPAPTGGVGLGTYRTAVEFKDVRVTRGGETLFTADFATEAKGWQLPRDGKWGTAHGALVQSDMRAISTAWTDEVSWTDYTVSLKARKIGGAEGFIVVVRNDHQNTRVQWNVGGWGNTRHGIQSWLGVQEQFVAQTPGSIEPDRWYDVRLELKGPRLDCYLDDKLVQTAEIPLPKREGLYASAVRDDRTGEIIVKVVNAFATPAATEITLAGIKSIRARAQITVLTAAALQDANSLDEPNKIAPRTETLKIPGSKFTHTFPRYSFTVLRMSAGKSQAGGTPDRRSAF